MRYAILVNSPESVLAEPPLFAFGKQRREDGSGRIDFKEFLQVIWQMLSTFLQFEFCILPDEVVDDIGPMN